MLKIFPKKPFYAQYEFLAFLSKSNLTVDGLHVFVEYPENRPGVIRGYVLGGQSEGHKLSELMNRPDLYCTLVSASNENAGETIESHKARIKSATIAKGGLHYTPGMTDIVGELEFDDITVTRDPPRNKGDKRRVVFALVGPITFWPDYNIDLDIGYLFDGRVKVRPRFFHSTIQHEGRELKVEDVAYTLCFETAQPGDTLPDDKLLETAIRLADDITLLASFASRRWIRWFKYELFGQKHVSYTRPVYDCSSENLHWEDMLVTPGESKEFLRTAIEALDHLRKDNMSLFLPIVTTLAGHRSEYVEQEFTLYFLALEQIKDIYARKHDLNKTIKSEAQWDKLKNRVKEVISDFVKDLDTKKLIDIAKAPDEKELRDNARKLMEDKLGELQRPPLRSLIERICGNYSVSWEDLCPPDREATFFNTRNRLFHGSEEIDIKKLVYETDRVQSLVERLILRMLGWDDLSQAPHETLRYRLSSES